MIKNYLKILGLFICAAILNSCGSNNERKTFFGGKIINPKTKTVILYALDQAIDTLKLDANNRFIGSYKNFKEGLYYFTHGNENQYIYIEPQDSLMLRLNTWDFDESLVFAGKGAERNNILVDIFLENEKHNAYFYNLANLKPAAYKAKIDSILSKKHNTLLAYKEKHPNETDAYLEILNIALTYPIYSKIEKYPIRKLASKEDLKNSSVNLFSYRETIDFNNKKLMYYTPYIRYIRNYLYNVAYSKGHTPKKDQYTENFTIDLMQVINDKLTHQKFKNLFLKRTILDHFYTNSSCMINNVAFDNYFKLSSNAADKAFIKKLLDNNTYIKKGDEIKDFSIYNFTNQPIDIQDFTLNKNTLLLFWHKEFMTKNYLSTRIPYLQKENPNLNIAVIEINGNTNTRIENINIKNQYFINTEALKTNFLSSHLPRVILVNKNGIVENGFASISSIKISKQLKALTKNN